MLCETVTPGSSALSLVSADETFYASLSSLEVFGYTPQQLAGLHVFDLIHPADFGVSIRALGNVRARPSRPAGFTARVLQLDGTWRPMEITLSNLMHEHGVAAFSMKCREPEEHVAVSPAKPTLNGEVLLSSAGLEQFAATVAHDLREPLRTISMFTELLLRDLQLDSAEQMRAQFIIDGVARASSLLEGLQAVTSSGHKDALQSVDLAAVVRESVLNLGHAIDASDGIVTADPLPTVKGNKNDLIRVFQNLIMNALKYRSGGPVEVHLSTERPGDEWLIRVKDNGIGIAKEYQQRIFLPMKRLHGREIPGVGLGLAICRKIVESFGGSIWVESEPGAGATFCFTIAAAQGAAVSTEGPAPLELNAVPTSLGALYAVNGH
jgi:PAS domain S-box-containing protein